MKRINLEETQNFLNELKIISSKYDKKVPEQYIDWIVEIWSEVEDEIKQEENRQKKEIEEENNNIIYDEWSWYNGGLAEIR